MSPFQHTHACTHRQATLKLVSMAQHMRHMVPMIYSSQHSWRNSVPIVVSGYSSRTVPCRVNGCNLITCYQGMHHSVKIFLTHKRPQLVHHLKPMNDVPGHQCQLHIHQKAQFQEYTQATNLLFWGVHPPPELKIPQQPGQSTHYSHIYLVRIKPQS